MIMYIYLTASRTIPIFHDLLFIYYLSSYLQASSSTFGNKHRTSFSAMPIDTDQIRFLLGTLEAAGKELTDSYPLSERQRYEIIQSAEKLAIAAREPEENVYYIATQVSLQVFHAEHDTLYP